MSSEASNATDRSVWSDPYLGFDGPMQSDLGSHCGIVRVRMLQGLPFRGGVRAPGNNDASNIKETRAQFDTRTLGSFQDQLNLDFVAGSNERHDSTVS